jgi:hypothetical protein
MFPVMKRDEVKALVKAGPTMTDDDWRKFLQGKAIASELTDAGQTVIRQTLASTDAVGFTGQRQAIGTILAAAMISQVRRPDDRRNLSERDVEENVRSLAKDGKPGYKVAEELAKLGVLAKWATPDKSKRLNRGGKRLMHGWITLPGLEPVKGTDAGITW